jgi:hypothetical protein
MVLYQIPSLDPALAVTVGWDPELASFVARVDSVAPRPTRDGEGGVVAWFGTRPAELVTVCDLQQAIRRYAAIRPDVRAALEVDQATGPPRPGPAPLAATAHRVAGPGPATAPAAGRGDAGRPRPRPESMRPAPVGLLVVLLLLAAVAVVVALALWPTP